MGTWSGTRTSLLLGVALIVGIIGCGPMKPIVPSSTLSPPPNDLPPEQDEEPLVPHPRLKMVSAAAGGLDLPDAPMMPARRPENILALSGGGSLGAFTAGVINGWSRTNHRPQFDVVTGISTGALIAPLVFLGPKYDNDLKRSYTEIRQRDVFAIRNWATIPFRDSVATSTPLRRMVEATITEDVMAQIAAEHRKGRRLYMGTTLLETRRPVVWDMGAIAARGGPNSRRLFCDLMLASAAIPGMFPPVSIPVEIDGKTRQEMHVDGGVTNSVFVPASVMDAAASTPGDNLPACNLYIVVAGRYFPGSTEVRPRLLKVVKASGGALLSARLRGDLANLYHMSKLNGIHYHSVALRQDYPLEDVAIEFDQKVMTQLFVEGVKVGLEGPSWDRVPPERAAADDGEIRTGTQVRPKP